MPPLLPITTISRVLRRKKWRERDKQKENHETHKLNSTPKHFAPLAYPLQSRPTNKGDI